MENAALRAATGHLLSGLVALSALIVGVRWVQAGGEPVAIPATLIVVSLVVLTPLAMHRSWHSRGEFIDSHVEAACRFLTVVGTGAALVIGLPALVAWLLPSGTELWSSVMVLPYLGALAIPVAWAFFAMRAAVMAFNGAETPFPRWMLLPGMASLR
ncbi:MAG: hypothetical protein HKO63_05660 [Acidimicrobiia bacterium]|nr:hypothetical protein [Acidimicrobiia bacterium]MBT8194606.1 hypothetical protein [Acidimicrobiia bacterium]NNF87196.1 hypothetical protein [Acidimicrobiia bacterium]NNL13394.1 hypothetical protein [Acidimicrobiia bacterium]NNL14689.1 hypothetical protein [Acidimicrobiia bacterium]